MRFIVLRVKEGKDDEISGYHNDDDDENDDAETPRTGTGTGTVGEIDTFVEFSRESARSNDCARSAHSRPLRRRRWQ